jgi:chromosome segregation ATPase
VLLGELKTLRAELARHEKARAQVEKERAQVEKERASLDKGRAGLKQERRHFEAERAGDDGARMRRAPDRESTPDVQAKLAAQLEESRVQHAKVAAERHAVRVERDQHRARAEERLATLKALQAEHERVRTAYRQARKEIAALRSGLLGRLRVYLRGLPIPGAPWRRPQPSESRPK